MPADLRIVIAINKTENKKREKKKDNDRMGIFLLPKFSSITIILGTFRIKEYRLALFYCIRDRISVVFYNHYKTQTSSEKHTVTVLLPFATGFY